MMDLNIRELSDSFSELLPHDKQKYTLSDIDSSGIPFLVRKKIIQIIYEQFKKSVRQPQSEWADVQSSKAKAIWSSYLEQMKDLLEIPADKVNEVLYEAVEFALKLAIQPRKTILKALFEGKDAISKDEIDELMEQFKSNRHLAFALSRYMEKKQKDSLGIDEAKQVMKRVDEKLTESYNSLDWMEAVKPIFHVAGPLVSSDFIRIFFEEKEMHRVARKYDMMEAEISETDFVEIMSSADLLDLSGFEEEQSALFTKEYENTKEHEPVETDEAEEEKIDDEESAKSSLSDIFMSGDEAEEEKEKSVNELDEETESSPLDGEQEPYLLELFHEDDEADFNKQEGELLRNEDDENERTAEIAPESEMENESESVKMKTEFSDDNREEIVTPEEEPEDEEANTPTDFEEGELEENEDVSLEEDSNQQNEEMPLEDKLISDKDESVEEGVRDDDVEMEEESLLDRYTEEHEQPDVEQEEEYEQQEENDTKSTSIYDELNLSPVEEDDVNEEAGYAEKTELDDEEPDKSVLDDDIPFEPNDRFNELPGDQTDSHDSLFGEEPDNIEQEKSEDVPMWKSFLERENPDDEPSFYFDEGSDDSSDEVNPLNSDEEEINETPVINITDDASKIDDEIEQLTKWLASDRERFIHEIFDDSNLAWEQALIDLTVFDDWKSASRYLEKEIFNKNRIDIYSEIAVDFTDYLHSYFMEYKS